MKGKHHIIIESAHLKYEFDIRRNITIIQGDSATGKTTLIELLSDYRGGQMDSPVRIESDIPCEVLNKPGERWEQILDLISDSIIFIDEDNHFIRSKEFAEAVRGSSNYFVLITREVLPLLPYSINEVYGIRTSGKYHFPEQVYHEFYPIYGDELPADEDGFGNLRLITEDSESGLQFFKGCLKDPAEAVGAGGNSKVYQMMKEQPEDSTLAVIADGAAFGAYAARVLEYADLRGNTMLYFPESFEWLILKAGVISSGIADEILMHPEDHIDSKNYMSWEQYFAQLLISETKDDEIRAYRKSSLKPYYLGKNVRDKILKVIPGQLQKWIEG